MNRQNPSATRRSPAFIEALEPRIAPAGLLNESKFTSVTLGTPLLLDASGQPGDFQGITTGTGGGSGSYLLYLTAGKALVYTTDLNGDGRFEPNEITGIALAPDSQGRAPSLILFNDVHGDIVTNLQPGHGVSALSNSGTANDGHLLLDTPIANITLRAITATDLDPTIPNNTVGNRAEPSHFSIFGNVISGGNFGGLTIDSSGAALAGAVGSAPQVGGIYTGTAANSLSFTFTYNNPGPLTGLPNPTLFNQNVGGTFLPFHPAAGEHGGDITGVQAASPSTLFSIGTLATGDGGGGARGGNLTNVTLHGDTGSYQVLAGNGGSGVAGGQGGSIVNFNDLGTVTGEVLLHTGDGGAGPLGAGGAGGTATFATAKIAAAVHVSLGNGGDGVTAGGSGASQPTATFNTPETLVPAGSKFFGTWHDTGDVGNTHPLADGTYAPEVINFNPLGAFATAADAARHGDNFGDGVFTTSKPDQVVVVFGDGLGSLVDNGGNFNSGAASETVILKVPGVTNPVVTFGDFNGDGRLDIAVASGDANNAAGLYVFLNQIGTAADPLTGHHFTGNPLGDHPFSAPLQSPMPALTVAGLSPVYALAAGDFNGDGVTDIAYVQKVPNQIPNSVVGYLFGTGVQDATGKSLLNSVPSPYSATPVLRPAATGFFFANAGAPGQAPLLQNYPVAADATSILHASSLTRSNVPGAMSGVPLAAEQLFYALPGDTGRSILEFNAAPVNPLTHLPTNNALATAFAIGLGVVDTNRMPASGNNQNFSPVAITLQGFTLQDLNNDGSTDIAVLSKAPTNFLSTIQGNGRSDATNFARFSSGSGVDQAGFLLEDPAAGLTSTALAISDAATPGTFNTAAVLATASAGALLSEFDLAQAAAALPGPLPIPLTRAFAVGAPTPDLNVQGLDAFYTVAPSAGNLHPVGGTGYGVLSPDTTDFILDLGTNHDVFGLQLTTSLTLARPFTENGYLITAGSGGNSQAGPGGDAGTLGGTTAGAITITFPAAFSYAGDALLQGGAGGSGFTTGGKGGDVSGITASYLAGTLTGSSLVQNVGGNGGNGNLGDGGRGGNLSQLTITNGDMFSGGNGGSGSHGGAGGSIAGKGAGLGFDTSNNAVALTAGFGGTGALGGGTGGAVTNWDSRFNSSVLSALTYTAGAGGAAAGGNGGTGGAILNSSPDSGTNLLSGPLTLRTGGGGNGLIGGAGGALTNFVNTPTNSGALPSVLTVEAGGGGIGISGAGGLGGTITNFQSNATGLVVGPATGLARVIAGAGGASFGNAGGAGGSITGATSQATSTPLLAAAGAGGNGLLSGGLGGSVTNSTFNSAAGQFAKLLVIAGGGGNATASAAADHTEVSDTLAQAVLGFGGAAGIGGDGGSIVNLTQPTGVQTAVDLIAGNGGSTINSGTPLASLTTVGRGGSVTGATLAGTVGSLTAQTTNGTPTFANIKSYVNDDPALVSTLTIAPFAQFVDTIKNGGPTFVLNDALGNEGIVAGAAGTVRAVNGVPQPASNGINGAVQNVRASSIMSIVAGSVNFVSPVRLVSGLTVTNVNGVLGADESPIAAGAGRNPGPDGLLQYNSHVPGAPLATNLQAGYGLIDGAIYATTIQSNAGGQPIRGPRVFPVT